MTTTIGGTPTTAGTYYFSIYVSDDGGMNWTQADYTLVVSDPPPPPPSLAITTSSPLPDGTTDTGYSQQLNFSGGGGSSCTWLITSGSLPSGLWLDSWGGISGTPTAAGTSYFTVQVEDGTGSASADFQITINGPPLSPVEITTGSPLPDGLLGVYYAGTFNASGGSGSYTWSVVSGSLPSGLNLDSNGTLSGAPTMLETSYFTVAATDSYGTSGTKEVSLTVSLAPVQPGSSGLPEGMVGTPYSQALSATGGYGTYSWSLIGGNLPSGLSLGMDGTISGTPWSSGYFSFTVGVSDGMGGYGQADFQINISDIPPPPPLTITTGLPLPSGWEGISYQQSLTASGGSGSYTWTVVSGSLPSGLDLDSNGTISGTPMSQVNSSFQVSVSDGSGGSVQAEFQIAINAPPYQPPPDPPPPDPPPSALAMTSSSPLSNGTLGTSYQQSLSASYGSGSYTWSLIGGSLPSGLSLDPNGTISGTPAMTGNFIFQVSVSDEVGGYVNGWFEINIDDSAPLQITTGSPLPGGEPGGYYSGTLAAEGGAGDKIWSVTDGLVPDGLLLDSSGNLAGMPSTAGSYSFTVLVQDSYGHSVSKSFDMAINTPASGNTFTSNEAGYLSFNGGNYAAAASNEAFTPATGTFELWFRSTDTTDDRLFAGTYNISGGYCFKVFNSDGTSKCRFVFTHSGGAPELEQTSGVNIRDGEWHHLAATWDSSTLSLWIDGVWENTTSVSTPVAGSDMMFGAVPFLAHIEACDIRLARLSSSVRYTTGFARPTTLSSDGDTIGLWAMTQENGSVAHDFSDHGFEATLVPDSGGNYPVWGSVAGTGAIQITSLPEVGNVDGDSVQVSWNVDNTTGMSLHNVVHYSWTDGENSGTGEAWLDTDGSSGLVSVTVEGLVAGRSYSFWVESGSSNQSIVVTSGNNDGNNYGFITEAAPAIVFSGMSGPTIQQHGDDPTQYDISWDVTPVNPANHAHWVTVLNSEITAVGTEDGNGHVTATLTGLSLNTEYHFTIQSSGWGQQVTQDNSGSGYPLTTPPPVPDSLQFSEANYGVGEMSTVTITVTRTGSNNGTVTVDYSASDGSASGTLSFEPSETSKSFDISTGWDGIYTGDRTVSLMLSNPQIGAVLGSQSSSTLTIYDSSPAPPPVQFESGAYSVNENGGSITITVTRTSSNGAGASVDYSASDGSTSGTVSFDSWETSKSFNVPVFYDSNYTGDRTISLTLSNPQGAILGSPASATLTIVETDSPPTGGGGGEPPPQPSGPDPSVSVSDLRVDSADETSATISWASSASIPSGWWSFDSASWQWNWYGSWSSVAPDNNAVTWSGGATGASYDNGSGRASVMLTGLTAAHNYGFTAVSSYGGSSASADGSFSTTTPPLPSPTLVIDSPISVTYQTTEYSCNTITVTWHVSRDSSVNWISGSHQVLLNDMGDYVIANGQEDGNGWVTAQFVVPSGEVHRFWVKSSGNWRPTWDNESSGYTLEASDNNNGGYYAVSGPALVGLGDWRVDTMDYTSAAISWQVYGSFGVTNNLTYTNDSGSHTVDANWDGSRMWVTLSGLIPGQTYNLTILTDSGWDPSSYPAATSATVSGSFTTRSLITIANAHWENLTDNSADIVWNFTPESGIAEDEITHTVTCTDTSNSSISYQSSSPVEVSSGTIRFHATNLQLGRSYNVTAQSVVNSGSSDPVLGGYPSYYTATQPFTFSMLGVWIANVHAETTTLAPDSAMIVWTTEKGDGVTVSNDEVGYWTSDPNNKTYRTMAHDESGFQLQGLQMNTTYNVEVRSYAPGWGWSPFSSAAQFTTLAGSYIRITNSPVVSELTSSNAVITLDLQNDLHQWVHHYVTYNWNSPLSIGTNQFSINSAGDASLATLSFTNLLPGMTYGYSLVSVLDGYDTNQLAYVFMTNGVFTTASSIAISNVSYSALTTNNVAITWDVQNNGGYEASHFVTVTGPGSPASQMIFTDAGPGNTNVVLSVSNLVAGGSYNYTVTSFVNDPDNHGVELIPGYYATGTNSFTVPSQPQPYVHITSAPTTGSVTGDSVRVSWGVENTTGQPVTNTIYYSWSNGLSSGTGQAGASTNINSGIVSVIIGALQPGFEYSFWVQSSMADGSMAVSHGNNDGNICVFSTPIPSLIILGGLHPENLVSTSADIVWDFSTQAGTNFNGVVHSVIDPNTGSVLASYEDSATNGQARFNLSSLTRSCDYGFTVQSVLKGDWSWEPWGNVPSSYTASGTVSFHTPIMYGVTVNNVSATAAVVNWTLDTTAESADISLNGESLGTFGNGSNGCTIGGLQPWQNYSFTLTASDGADQTSAPLGFLTASGNSVVNTGPGIVALTTAEMKWTNTSYQCNGSYHWLSYSNQNGSCQIPLGWLEDGEHTFWLSDLQPGQNYGFAILADDNMYGPASTSGAFTTLPAMTLTNVRAENVTSSGMDIVWAVNPPGFASTYYWGSFSNVVSYADMAGSEILTVWGYYPNSGDMCVSLTGLLPGHTYNINAQSMMQADSTHDPAFPMVYASSDWVQKKTAPAVRIVSSPSVTSVSPNSATISWSVENDTSQLLWNRVYYAEVGNSSWSFGQASGISDASGSGSVVVEVGGLTAGKNYAFAVRSEVYGSEGALAGNSDFSVGETTAYQFATASAASVDPAIAILSVGTDWITDTAAKITWWVTQIDPFAVAQHFAIVNSNAPPATLDGAVIAQGFADPYQPDVISAVVTNLTAGHDYYFYVQSSLDFTEGRYAIGMNGDEWCTFHTTGTAGSGGTQGTTPLIEIVVPPNTNYVTSTEAFITWEFLNLAADSNAAHFVVFSPCNALNPANAFIVSGTDFDGFDAGAILSGLPPGNTNYYYFVQSVLDLGEGHFATSPGNGLLNSFTLNPPGDLAALNNLLAGFASGTSSGGTTGGSTGTDPQAGAFEFDQVAYSADAQTADTTVTVQVVRTGGQLGNVTVHFATLDGSAHAGTDYNNVSATLSFADGEASKTVTISLHQSPGTSDTKTILLSLSGPTGGATVGMNSMATIFVTGPVLDPGNTTTLFGVQVPPSLSATPPGAQPPPVTGAEPEQQAGPQSVSTAAPDQSLHGGCGNPEQRGPAGKDDKCNSPNPIKLFTANAHREIPDLEVWGGVGEHQLVWKRLHNTRYANEVSYFGDGGCWRHSYQWELVDNGLGNSVTIYCPDGSSRRFWNSGGNWRSTPNVSERLMTSGSTFILQTSNGWRYFFEVYGSSGSYHLTHFTDSQQNVYTLTYDSTTGLLSSIQEPAGRYLQINYRTVPYMNESEGVTLIASVETSDGRSVSYSYGGVYDWIYVVGDVLLTVADYGDGTAANYAYAQINGSRPLLQHAIDPHFPGQGSNIRYKYYETGPVGSLQAEINGADPHGAVLISIGSYYSASTSYVPGVHYGNGANERYEMPVGLVATHVDALGRRTDYQYDQGEYGYQTGKTDPQGRITQWTKSNYDNVLCQRHPDNTLEFWLRNDEFDSVTNHVDTLGRSTVYVRDSFNRVTETRYPDGTTEEFTYNEFGQVLSHKLRNGGIEYSAYDARGLKTQSTDPLGHVTQYSYEQGTNRLSSVTDPRGNTTSFAYNSRGLVTQITYPGPATKSFEYDAFGNRTKVTDELGHSWLSTYDEFRRLTAVTDPLGRTTRYGYGDGGGCGSCGYRNKPTMVILPSGKIIKTEYDVEWRKMAETVGYHSTDAATTRYAYDSAGNLSHITDPLGRQTKFGYDLQGRRTVTLDPLGNTTEWTYDLAGNKLTEKRPDNGITQFVYNEMDQPTNITDRAGHVTQMTYLNGNLTGLTDARGNTYSFIYDNLNRRTRMTYPDGSHEDYAYDNAGNLATYTNRAGQQRLSHYDERNREYGQEWSPSTAAPVVAKNYDVAGRLTMLANQNSTITYNYDEANRLISESQAVSGQPSAAVVHYTYDPDGNRTSMTYPDGTVVNYSYTGRNQLAAVAGSQGIGATYQYDAAGNRITKTLGNGITTSYGYDAASQLLTLNSQLSTFSYEYNSVGNRTSKTQTDAGAVPRAETYGYDATDQLTGVNYNNQHATSYNYDAVGNRLSTTYDQQSTSYTPNALNQYSSVAGEGLSYDSKGNLTSLNGQLLVYDAQNRLVSVSSTSSAIQTAYDASSRCVSRTINGVTTYFYYDDWNVIEEHNASGNLLAKYIHGPNVDEILCRITPTVQNSSIPSILYYHADALGSVTHLTDTSGTVVERYTYDVFGQPTVLSANSQSLTASAVGNRFLFTGREWFGDIALYDYRNRAYSPELGRFLQTDPMGFNAGDENFYRYVGNNASDSVDPFGNVEWHTGGTEYRELHYVQSAVPYTGTRPIKIGNDIAAFTTMEWDIEVTCCDSRPYSLKTIGIDYRVVVYIRQGMHPHITQKALAYEQEHINDFLGIPNPRSSYKNKPGAVERLKNAVGTYETSQKNQPFGSKQQCEQQVRAGVQGKMHSVAGAIYNRSISEWDNSGKHRMPPPNTWFPGGKDPTQ